MKHDRLSFDIQVVVGTLAMPMVGYCELQIGDILLLDQKVGEPLSVKIGEETRFYGHPGLMAMRKAVKIYE